MISTRVFRFYRLESVVDYPSFSGIIQIETLNNLLPCTPLSKESNHRGPLLVCQVTMFACGGIALGICASHKITDANTTVISGLSKASLIFPPKNPMPKNYIYP
ncbi:hypothetical protein PVK06_010359 [Gossypium arboreum]|uniref:Uncharacterized protein n=1 Tax=Gossypium arboreum TaxID=29729 RepID=A0ABR0Q722_GOSAR|nr:hypothetical protein PVK06_010359 [Gossypium arboreum]